MKTKIRFLLPAFILACSITNLAYASQESDTLEIRVEGLCGMCKTRIEKAALRTKGVTEATWDTESRKLSVVTDPDRFKENKLHYHVASAGHDTEELLAPDPVYESLPQCCKYRDYANHDEAIGKTALAITGYVYESDESGSKSPLAGASVFWAGTSTGTITGEDGLFSIDLQEGYHMLIVSFVGYGSDTLHLLEPSEVEVGFSTATMLDEVSVVHRIKATSFSFTSAYNIQNISEKELTRAACCNLSESFETNPSVDASFTDAVTGTRKIEMLGLAGPYVQITRENMPDVRGLSSLYGLTYIPGTWIEAIQLNTALNLNNPVPTGASSAGSSEFFIPGIEYFGFWAGFGSEDPLQSGLWDGSLAVLNPDEISTFASFTPAVPVPAAVWLFGSGLLGLIGIARRKTS